MVNPGLPGGEGASWGWGERELDCWWCGFCSHKGQVENKLDEDLRKVLRQR